MLGNIIQKLKSKSHYIYKRLLQPWYTYNFHCIPTDTYLIRIIELVSYQVIEFITIVTGTR